MPTPVALGGPFADLYMGGDAEVEGVASPTCRRAGPLTRGANSASMPDGDKVDFDPRARRQVLTS